ncbi:aldo/keto reductase [Sphingobacteriaceae bacterium]|nr:aldo/keto reductase [Sphingobacteriaceae bacterium]
MKKINLSENGPEVSPLIYSFWRAMEDKDGVTYESILGKLDACLELGINTFDHADVYGNYRVEKLFGKALKESRVKREEIVISTKCGINNVDQLRPAYRTRHYDSSSEYIRSSVEKSLENLGTDYLDILLLHHPDPLMDADDTASELTKLVNKGLVKYIGVANFTVHQHRLLQSRLSIPIITNHLELNVMNTSAIKDGTLDFIKEHYSKPLAWSPLAGGRLVDENDAATYNVRNTLKKLAANYNCNEEQIAIAWLLRLGALPILGTNSISRIKNAASAVTIELDKQDWHEIYFSGLATN